MYQLNEHLRQLALNAKRHPPRSRERRIALTRLIIAVQNSDRLFCQGKSNFPTSVYEEALQETWMYICQNIDKFNSEVGSVMIWINRILNWRFTNAINRFTKRGQEISIDTPKGDSDNSLLDILEQPEDFPSDSDRLRQYIDEDPTGIFQQTHVEGRPEANFRAIFLRRFDNEPWQVLASDWGISVPTLSGFFQRCIRRFAPDIRQHLED